MNIAIAATAAIAVLFCSAARAEPSFNCAKAAGAVETTVCKSASLEKADGDLAAAYHNAMAGLSEGGRADLLSGQRQWLRFRDDLCGTPGPEDDIENCLANLYADRLERLRAPLAAGDMQFRRVDLFHVVRGEDDTGTGVEVARQEVSYPLIDAPRSPGEEAFNAMMRHLAAKDASPLTDAHSDIGLSFDEPVVTGAVISVTLEHYYYGHGAAHGLFQLETVNWLRQAGRELRASDVFLPGSAWRQALREACFRKFHDPFFVHAAADLDATADNVRSWTLTPNGLEILFNIYEVAPYAAGDQTVTVPWASLKSYLAKDAPIPAK